jgi:medium-chain acyl-[acyl-carrier-protein] hydrolase
MRHRANPWFVCLRESPRALLRLFCFPYAGAGASVYNRWHQCLPEEIEITAVQLPGRETRFHEPAFTNLGPLLTTLSDAMLDQLDRPFAFFGHSMGALIGFELTRLLRRDFRLMPSHLFLSGLRPVQLSDWSLPIHRLNLSDASHELESRYGVPGSALSDPELQQLLVPLIQADMAVCETYVYYEEEPLDCPISVFGGADDRKVNPEILKEWRLHTSGPFRIQILPGDHFFLNPSWAQVSRLVLEDLVPYIFQNS